MSGGSYNYLFAAVDCGTLADHRSDIEAVQKRLVELGHQAAADATQRVLEHLDAAVRQAGELGDVWHAVEWLDSGDWTEEWTHKVIAEFETPKEPSGQG